MVRFVLLFAVLMLTACYQYAELPGSFGTLNSVFQVSGSLVVAVPTKKGLVVCADKRTNDNLRGDLDTATKITQVSPNAAAASTGTPVFLDRTHFRRDI